MLVVKIYDTLVVNIYDVAYFFPPYLCSVVNNRNFLNMEQINSKQEDICQRAENLIYRNNLIIAELDNWMPSEEANANLMREIIERNRKSQRLQVPPNRGEDRNNAGNINPTGGRSIFSYRIKTTIRKLKTIFYI